MGKKRSLTGAGVLLLAVLAFLVTCVGVEPGQESIGVDVGEPAPLATNVYDSGYNTRIWTEQGGNKMVVASGGEIEVQSGGTLDVQSGAMLGGVWATGGNSGLDAGSAKLGTTDNVSVTLIVSNSAALRIYHDAASPRLVGGYVGNSATGAGAVVAGGGQSGRENVASGAYSFVGGGIWNTASGDYATVGGGGGNYNNIADGDGSVVSGGEGNYVYSLESTISGGYYNRIWNGYWNTIAGGRNNTITNTAFAAIVVGGRGNTASGDYATTSGGYHNTASGDYSFVAGQYATADDNSFVWGGSGAACASTAANQFVVCAPNGATFDSFVQVGTSSATCDSSTVGAIRFDSSNGDFLGCTNDANDDGATGDYGWVKLN